MIHIRPPCNHYWHLSICLTVANVLAHWRRSNRFQVFVAGMWRFASVSVADRLLVRFFVRDAERWKSLDPLLPNRVMTGLRCCGWEVVDSRSDFPLLGSLRNIWPASDLQKTSTWSKLSPRGCRNMTPIFFSYTGIQALLPRGTNA